MIYEKIDDEDYDYDYVFFFFSLLFVFFIYVLLNEIKEKYKKYIIYIKFGINLIYEILENQLLQQNVVKKEEEDIIKIKINLTIIWFNYNY